MIEDEVERILKKQYENGKKIIKSSSASQELFKQIQKECPHVPEEELIRLFPSVAAGTKMVDPAIIASAHNKEYNAVHPAPSAEIWFSRFFTDETKKIIRPKEVLKKKQIYAGLVKVISDLERKYDDRDKPPIAVFRRHVLKYLQKNVKKK